MCAREVWPGHSLKKKKRYCQEESDECCQEEMRVANEVQRVGVVWTLLRGCTEVQDRERVQ